MKLTGADAETYRRMVDQQLQDHPFLQNQELKNDVLKALVLAHGIANELIEDEDVDILRHASRQPFLWRSVQAGLPSEERELLRGEYLGPVLNSLWNDPVAIDVQLDTTDDADDPGFLALAIRESGREWRLQTVAPLEFYGQLRDCNVDTTAPLTLRGHAGTRGVASFDIRGDVILIARDALTIEAAAVRINGKARIFAGSVEQPGNLAVTPNGSQLWFGGRLEETRPWRDLPSTLPPPPVELQPRGRLERLVEQCSKRIPSAAPIVVYEGTYAPADHRKMRWLDNDPSGELFPKLLQLMVKKDFARADPFGASGAAKVRLHFDLSWTELLEALRAPSAEDERLRKLVADARELFGRPSDR